MFAKTLWHALRFSLYSNITRHAFVHGQSIGSICIFLQDQLTRLNGMLIEVFIHIRTTTWREPDHCYRFTSIIQFCLLNVALQYGITFHTDITHNMHQRAYLLIHCTTLSLVVSRIRVCVERVWWKLHRWQCGRLNLNGNSGEWDATFNIRSILSDGKKRTGLVV